MVVLVLPVCVRGLESAPRCPCSGQAGRAINHPPAGKLRASRAGSSHPGSVYGQVMVMEVEERAEGVVRVSVFLSTRTPAVVFNDQVYLFNQQQHTRNRSQPP